MNATAFKAMLGVLQIIAGVIGPYAAGMSFNMQTLFLNVIAALAGGHALTSAMRTDR